MRTKSAADGRGFFCFFCCAGARQGLGPAEVRGVSLWGEEEWVFASAVYTHGSLALLHSCSTC